MEAGRSSAAEVAAVLSRVRERRPLVHCITNIVVAGLTAKVLLAAGASPAMVETRRSQRSSLRLPTLTAERDHLRQASIDKVIAGLKRARWPGEFRWVVATPASVVLTG